ncbi:MAG: hypothetical protein WCF23_12480 [Candidatus Nitrosopolaris sp.]
MSHSKSRLHKGFFRYIGVVRKIAMVQRINSKFLLKITILVTNQNSPLSSSVPTISAECDDICGTLIFKTKMVIATAKNAIREGLYSTLAKACFFIHSSKLERDTLTNYYNL